MSMFNIYIHLAFTRNSLEQLVKRHVSAAFLESYMVVHSHGFIARDVSLSHFVLLQFIV